MLRIRGLRFVTRGSAWVPPERLVLRPPAAANSAACWSTTNAGCHRQSWQGSHDYLLPFCWIGRIKGHSCPRYVLFYLIRGSWEGLPSKRWLTCYANQWGTTSWLTIHADCAGPMEERTTNNQFIYTHMSKQASNGEKHIIYSSLLTKQAIIKVSISRN